LWQAVQGATGFPQSTAAADARGPQESKPATPTIKKQPRRCAILIAFFRGHVTGNRSTFKGMAATIGSETVTNTRIVSLDDRTVTFRYNQRKSGRWRTCRIEGHEFIRRFLRHVLPKGLHKVRYFGLWYPAKRQYAAQARLLLELERTAPPINLLRSSDPSPADHSPNTAGQLRICPACGRRHLIYVRRLTPKNALGP
jgi:hypothetical protein